MAAAIASVLFASQTDAMTITHDNGGSVRERHAEIVAHVGEVRIDGRCNSSCTMWLAHDDVCVTHRASLGFHSPKGRNMNAETLNEWRIAIANHYPAPIKDWYLSKAGHKSKLSKIKGAELVRIGVKECEQ